jgi:hypothetical protein
MALPYGEYLPIRTCRQLRTSRAPSVYSALLIERQLADPSNQRTPQSAVCAQLPGIQNTGHVVKVVPVAHVPVPPLRQKSGRAVHGVPR